MTGDSLFVTFAPIVISTLSFIFAIIAFILNYRLSLRDKKRSEQLAELQVRLHELQLQREEGAAERRTSSKVEAHYARNGLKGHCIRVSNTGGTTVTDVTCEYDKNDGPYAFIQDKEPYEWLEPGESFDETILLAAASPRKFMVRTRWIGEDGEERSRENIISV